MARSAGKLEHPTRPSPIRFREREAGEEGRVAPAMSEVSSDRAVAQQRAGVAEAQPVHLAHEPGAVRAGRRRRVRPAVLVGEQQDERAGFVSRIEPGHGLARQLSPVSTQERDALNDGPALAAAALGRERVHGVAVEEGARDRRSEGARFPGGHGSPASASAAR